MNYSIIFTEISFSPETSKLHYNEVLSEVTSSQPTIHAYYLYEVFAYEVGLLTYPTDSFTDLETPLKIHENQCFYFQNWSICTKVIR